MTIQIRKANPADAVVLSDLSMRSKQSNGYDVDFMDACREELAVTADDFRTTEYWVAQADRVCGMVGLILDADGQSAVVSAFFIDPDHKRQGIGRMLWQVLLDHAATNGLQSLRLDADPAAVPFYEALGFTTTRMVPSGSIKGRSLPHMVLELV